MKIHIHYCLSYLLCLLLALSCQNNNITIDPKIETIIQDNGFEGGFMLLDNIQGKFTVSNLKRDTTKVESTATLPLLYALIALETGTVNNIAEALEHQSSISSLLHKPTLTDITIFKKHIGDTKLKKYIDTIHYGNQSIDPLSISISVDEQIGFLKRFYFKQLPVSNRTNNILKENILKPMQIKLSKQYSITLLPPTAFSKGRNIWQLGWIEYEYQTFFFTLYLLPNSTASIEKAKKTLEEILNYLNIKNQTSTLINT